MYWQTSHRKIDLDRPLIMGILNVTPDSFSDGGSFTTIDDALRRVEEMIAEGADIIDVGGESTRPGSARIAADEEIRRTVPVVEAIVKRFDTPVSIDTTKCSVARSAMDAGAEIINDISGLRWDDGVANVAAETSAGLVLMHSRGDFGSMHTQTPVDDIFAEVTAGFRSSLELALSRGVSTHAIALDIGIGFGKTFEQNLELLAKLDNIVTEFEPYPLLVGVSRKSFIGKLLGGAPPDKRLSGSLASAAIAVFGGAKIIRVHDVRETVDALAVASAIRMERSK